MMAALHTFMSATSLMIPLSVFVSSFASFLQCGSSCMRSSMRCLCLHTILTHLQHILLLVHYTGSGKTNPKPIPVGYASRREEQNFLLVVPYSWRVNSALFYHWHWHLLFSRSSVRITLCFPLSHLGDAWKTLAAGLSRLSSVKQDGGC